MVISRGWLAGRGRNAQCGVGDPTARSLHSSSSAPHPSVLYAVLGKILFGEKTNAKQKFRNNGNDMFLSAACMLAPLLPIKCLKPCMALSKYPRVSCCYYRYCIHEVVVIFNPHFRKLSHIQTGTRPSSPHKYTHTSYLDFSAN